MLNIVWPLFIVIGCFFGIINGKIFEINTAIFNSINETMEFVIVLIGTMGLWNGIMQIASNTKIIKIINKILKPIIKILFPGIKEDMLESKEISMNITANIMGLGNAATPLGLKAMKSMQEKNKNKNRLSNNMAMFIIINTASIQIIPTTVIAIRNSLGSLNSAAIIIPVWIATICAAFGAVLSAKIFMKRF